MSKHIAKYLEGNWDEIKGKVKQKWAKLTDDDILQIEGSYDELSGKLEKIYGNKIDDIQDEITTFLSKHGFKDKNSRKEEAPGEISSMKETIFEYMDDYFQTLKQKSAYIEEKTTQSVKDNPVKWLGLAALTGFVLAKLLI
jgi:uncharacterized protein YjbJ (UPF0337 family)